MSTADQDNLTAPRLHILLAMCYLVHRTGAELFTRDLALWLRRRGHSVAREVLIPVFYEGVVVARYRMDLIVDDCVIVEVKSTEVLNPNDQRQLLNYLRATPLEVGLLLHFGPRPKVHRVAAPNE